MRFFAQLIITESIETRSKYNPKNARKGLEKEHKEHTLLCNMLNICFAYCECEAFINMDFYTGSHSLHSGSGVTFSVHQMGGWGV